MAQREEYYSKARVMNYYSEDYYRYKVIRGIPFDVRVCPDRDYEKNVKNETNKNSDEPYVCLGCSEEKCTGTRGCYERRLGQILRERKAAERERIRKEVTE